MKIKKFSFLTTPTLVCAALGVVGGIGFSGPANAVDWPHFRGPAHDGKSPETGILKTWPQEGPKIVWKVPIGEGFSAITVSQGKAFSFVDRNRDEFAIAMDAQTGKELWATRIDKSIIDRQGGDGPRSTPAVDGDKVYILGTHLKLVCLNAADGKQVWAHDLVQEYGGREPRWGSAASPVIEGDLIFVMAGGAGQALLAFNKSTGALAWKGQDDELTHATPTPATIHGVRQIIFRTGEGLVSVVPQTGNVLWRYSFPHEVSSAASPVVGGDIVYVSSAYNVGAGACRVTKEGAGFKATELWRAPGKMMNHWMTPVYHNGYIYGLYRESPSVLRCVDIATGKEMWAQRGFGWQGATILVEGHVIVQDDRGEIVMVEATPDRYKEVSRAHPLGGKAWTMPVLSNGRLYARNTEEVVCLDVSGK